MAPALNMHLIRFALLLAVPSSPAFGFTQPCQRIPTIASLARPTLTLSKSNDFDVTRAEFFYKSITGSAIAIALAPDVAKAFDGGVGGLGKTRPQTGVVFRDPEAAAEITQSKSGDVTYELVAPDGSPTFLSFSAPWPLSKSAAGIEARDISGGYESSFVQVAELPSGTSLETIKPAIISQTLFGSTGKFGMYGAPTDVKIKKASGGESSKTTVYQASFTALTPAMRESDRKAFISASVVGNGLFLLVTSSTSARFGKLEGSLRKVADSFSAIPAPKSNLNQRK